MDSCVAPGEHKTLRLQTGTWLKGYVIGYPFAANTSGYIDSYCAIVFHILCVGIHVIQSKNTTSRQKHHAPLLRYVQNSQIKFAIWSRIQ